ncbi:GGDEF domain-containing protein [Rubrobacter indicoceani]|uniref:GGDEF domain-containing protein n=1 Tax=Rubrobacter indicoceani TaxID=2051957 RepID=UPI000E5C2BDD|nr:GGDEF domain-containing protein [Rubrobacter indicoceani]
MVSFLWLGSGLMLAGLCAFVYLAVRIMPELTLRLQRRILTLVVLAGLVSVVAQLRNALIGLTSAGDSVAGIMLWSVFLEGPGVAFLLLAVLYLFRSEREEVSALRRSANVDPLTALHNQAYFRRAASRKMLQAREYGIPLSLAMLDLDDFKSYNDARGHESGNAALRSVADILRSSLRADDLVARYGGEEFVVLLACEIADAKVVLERIRLNVESFCRPENGGPVMTVSVGACELTGGMRSVEDFIETADAALYRAKSAGKNRVITSIEAA